MKYFVAKFDSETCYRAYRTSKCFQPCWHMPGVFVCEVDDLEEARRIAKELNAEARAKPVRPIRSLDFVYPELMESMPLLNHLEGETT